MLWNVMLHSEQQEIKPYTGGQNFGTIKIFNDFGKKSFMLLWLLSIIIGAQLLMMVFIIVNSENIFNA